MKQELYWEQENIKGNDELKKKIFIEFEGIKTDHNEWNEKQSELKSFKRINKMFRNTEQW